jgi:diguanylate cyclase (GGDEF)-like protein/PAS domain S-box-containing protein
MLRVLESLVRDHDLRLVLLAAAICLFGAIATMNVSGRVAGTRRSMLWLVLVSVCAGATVWSTHFIAMLAYMASMPMTYDPGLTGLSFVSGAILMGAGFSVAIRGNGTPRAGLVGGAIVGLGVTVLHYVGMAAVRLPGQLTYAPGLVATSILLSMGFGALALASAFGRPRANARTIGVLLMVVMIVALHFTAMGAVHIGHSVASTGLANGVSRSVLATAVAVASLSVLIIGLIGAVLDQSVSRKLAAEGDRFRTLADGALEGLVIHRDGVMVDANAAARRMFGLEENLSGQSIQGWFADPDQWDKQSWHAGAREEAAETLLRGPTGSSFPAEICRRRILLSDGSEAELLAIRDLTARKESEARIAHLALHDTLTDLPNRRFFMEMAQKTMSLAQRSGHPFALLALDLDNFKDVNDMYGHAAGDQVLKITAQRINATLRAADFSARFGGDEFAILQSNASSAAQTIALGERLLEALGAPVRVQGAEVTVSVSVGIALFPDDGVSVGELLRNADTAMYRAKADGKATLRYFEQQMDAALVARRKLENGLRRAVTEGHLTIAYQPIVDSILRAPVAFEALVRWTDPEMGNVTPAEFIPVAEETGLIVPIGEFVLREACKQAVLWPEPLRVAVNLSAVQFRRKGLVEAVRRALDESGLSGNRLELEVTEGLLMENRAEALQVLNQLKALGVLISMDDFGTGYSSLSYLQSFPFDKIKIDRAFVSDLPNNAQNASIVRAVAAMGKSLQMRVVAEGVETSYQADLLESLDCDELQGYLIARPMACSEIKKFLAGYAQDDVSPEVVAVA